MPRKAYKLVSLLLVILLVFQQSGFAAGGGTPADPIRRGAQVAAQLDIASHLSALRSSFVPDKFRPLHLRYLSYNSQENTFRLLLDKGDVISPQSTVDSPQVKQVIEETSKKLLKYFLIGLSLPNDTFWVNLRPDSPDNIIDPFLEQTDIGRIMLETDLQLKKDTAKATSPQTPEGKEYWDKLYKKAEELFGNENITIPTLTRPWIVPDEIIVRETTDSAYIYKATLKVMLEQDYLKSTTSRHSEQKAPGHPEPRRGEGSKTLDSSLSAQNDYAQYDFKDPRLKVLNEYSSQLIRELIIPKLTKEVNSAKRYASLRQVYYSLIMAQWFKVRFRAQSIVHSQQSIVKTNSHLDLIDSKNLSNLVSKEPYSKETYFQAYQKSFKEGEYNIKEPAYTLFGQVIRNYFSGGMRLLAIFPAQPGGTTTEKVVSIAAQGTPAPVSGPIIYGYYLNGEITINLSANRQEEQLKRESPGLTDNERKGFTHAHEIFHALVDKKGLQFSPDPQNSKAIEDRMANIFARLVFGIENSGEGDIFTSVVQDEQIWQLAGIRYIDPTFLVQLAGILDTEQIERIKNEQINELPEGAQAMMTDNGGFRGIAFEDWMRGSRPPGYRSTTAIITEARGVGISLRQVLDPDVLREWNTLVARITTPGGYLTSSQAKRIAELAQFINSEVGRKIQEKKGVSAEEWVPGKGLEEVTAKIINGASHLMPGDLIRSESGTERVVLNIRNEQVSCSVNKSGNTGQSGMLIGNIIAAIHQKIVRVYRLVNLPAIVQDNANSILSGQYDAEAESFGGNAGAYAAGYNGFMDREGRIVYWGSPQMLRGRIPDFQNRWENGELFNFTMRMRVNPSTWKTEHYEFAVLDNFYQALIPAAAIQRLICSITEAERKINNEDDIAITTEEWAQGKRPQGYVSLSSLIDAASRLGLDIGGIIGAEQHAELKGLWAKIMLRRQPLSRVEVLTLVTLSIPAALKLKQAISEAEMKKNDEDGIAITPQEWSEGKRPEGYARTTPVIQEAVGLGLNISEIIGRRELNELQSYFIKIMQDKMPLTRKEAKRLAELSQLVVGKLNAAIAQEKNRQAAVNGAGKPAEVDVQIKKLYKQIVMSSHPDLFATQYKPQAEEFFKEAQQIMGDNLIFGPDKLNQLQNLLARIQKWGAPKLTDENGLNGNNHRNGSPLGVGGATTATEKVEILNGLRAIPQLSLDAPQRLREAEALFWALFDEGGASYKDSAQRIVLQMNQDEQAFLMEVASNTLLGDVQQQLQEVLDMGHTELAPNVEGVKDSDVTSALSPAELAARKEPAYSIISPQERDSLGTSSWKDYLSAKRLSEAFFPPSGSPYSPKEKTINSIETIRSIKPRYSQGEERSISGIRNLIQSRAIDSHTAIILDSGGAHSVAMAIELMKQGYQPVVMFDGIPHPAGVNRPEQELATLLYFAAEAEKLKSESKFTKDSPPVFILDIHRNDKPFSGEYDNGYHYATTDFLSGVALAASGITKIIYLNEGNQDGLIQDGFQSQDRLHNDLKPIVREWESSGIKMFYTSVAPWESIDDGVSVIGIESKLSYPDMEPAVYGRNMGIAMHKNRKRFIFTEEGELTVINERGIARDMNSEEIGYFRNAIEIQLSRHPDDVVFRELYNKLLLCLGTHSSQRHSKGDISFSSAAKESPVGGIDFRNLPLVTQAVSNLSAGIVGSLFLTRLNAVNLDSKWQEIEHLVSSGITPSGERIKEYLQASCYNGRVAQDKKQVVVCISNILRMEEERYVATEPVLRDILIVLESGHSAQKLKEVFTGIKS